jgi:hypothetical protein
LRPLWHPQSGCPARPGGGSCAGGHAEGTAIDERTVIFAFGVGSGALLGFVVGCFATWGWLRRMRLMRSQDEWERARREGDAD